MVRINGLKQKAPAGSMGVRMADSVATTLTEAERVLRTLDTLGPMTATELRWHVKPPHFGFQFICQRLVDEGKIVVLQQQIPFKQPRIYGLPEDKLGLEVSR
jgi:hypothetical protein